MSDTIPFHINARDYDRLTRGSEREQELYRDYMETVMRPGSTAEEMTEARKAWSDHCERVAHDLAMILRFHHLVSDVLATGPGVSDA